jgi:hypothetical protein
VKQRENYTEIVTEERETNREDEREDDNKIKNTSVCAATLDMTGTEDIRYISQFKDLPPVFLPPHRP